MMSASRAHRFRDETFTSKPFREIVELTGPLSKLPVEIRWKIYGCLDEGPLKLNLYQDQFGN